MTQDGPRKSPTSETIAGTARRLAAEAMNRWRTAKMNPNIRPIETPADPKPDDHGAIPPGDPPQPPEAPPSIAALIAEHRRTRWKSERCEAALYDAHQAEEKARNKVLIAAGFDPDSFRLKPAANAFLLDGRFVSLVLENHGANRDGYRLEPIKLCG